MLNAKRIICLLFAMMVFISMPVSAAEGSMQLSDDASNLSDITKEMSENALAISEAAGAVNEYYTNNPENSGFDEDTYDRILTQSESISKQASTVSKKADALYKVITGEQLASHSTLEKTEGNIVVVEQGAPENKFLRFFWRLKEAFIKNFTKTFIEKDRYKLFIQGFRNTIIIAVFSTVMGVAIGMFAAIFKVYGSQKQKPNLFTKILLKILNLYTTVIRGTPVVVQLLIAYYIIFKSSQNDIMVSIFAFGINSGAYVSEIIRAGILAVDKGQTEAGRSLGLSYFSTMKSIIMPQAFKNILPALGNEFIAILKETSVAGYIAVIDLTKAGALIRSNTFEPYFSLLTVAVIYLVLVVGMSAVFKSIERRMAKSDRH